MPIYDYKCQDCGKVSEMLLRSAESNDVKCPNCGSKNLKRLISATLYDKDECPYAWHNLLW